MITTVVTDNAINTGAGPAALLKDTLAQHIPYDSLISADTAANDFQNAFTTSADHYPHIYDMAAGQADDLFIRVGPEQLFGPQSVLPDGAAVITEQIQQAGLLTDNICFKSLVILCFAGLCLLVYFYRAQIAALSGMFKGQVHTEKLLAEQNYLFDKFINISITLFIASLAVAITKYTDMPYGAYISSALPAWAAECIAPLLFIACAAVLLLKIGMLALTGNMTYNQSFTHGIIHVKKLVTAAGAVIVTPVILLYATSSGTSGQILEYLVASALAILVIFLLIRTYTLFIVQKVSIFYWILYLCAIEILPISLFALLSLKNI